MFGSRAWSERGVTWTPTLAGYGPQRQEIYRHVALSTLKHVATWKLHTQNKQKNTQILFHLFYKKITFREIFLIKRFIFSQTHKYLYTYRIIIL